MGLFNRILCPIDLSDHSRHALEYAVGIGRHYGASLTTLYVIPPPVPAVPTFDSPAYPGYVYTPEDLDAIEREVRNFVDSGHSGMSIESRVVQGFAVGQILDVAASMAVMRVASLVNTMPVTPIAEANAAKSTVVSFSCIAP